MCFPRQKSTEGQFCELFGQSKGSSVVINNAIVNLSIQNSPVIAVLGDTSLKVPTLTWQMSSDLPQEQDMHSSCIYGSKKVVVSSSIFFVFKKLQGISRPRFGRFRRHFEKRCSRTIRRRQRIAWMDPVAPGLEKRGCDLLRFAEVEPICKVQRFEQHACAEWVKFGEI